MRCSSLFLATLATYLTTSVAGRAVRLEARKKCSPPVTVTVTAAPTPTDTPTQTETESETTPPSMPTGVPSSGDGVFNLKHFFPVPFKKAYSTLPKSLLTGDIEYVDLNLDQLSATRITGGLSHDVVDAPGDAPDSAMAIQAKYPKGSYKPSGDLPGGLGFYLGSPSGAPDFKYEDAKEILVSYAVYFPEDFDWVKGGKLPGAYGGATADDAYGCSGGRQEGRDKCFSLRLMWRREGAGEIYTYVPKVPENDAAFNALKGTEANADYGWSVARGAFTWAKGWNTVAERVKLNTVGKADGEIELFFNGESKIKAENVMISQANTTVFRGQHFQTFYGGSDASWAPPKDEETYFAGVSAAIIS